MAKQKDKGLPTGITLRKDGRYMWRFKYSGVTYSGYSRKLSDAKKALRDKRYEVEHGLYSKEKAILFDAWFVEWLDVYKKADCKESTINLYKNVYNRYIKKIFGKKQVKNLRADMIQKFINKAATERSKTVASTINFLLYDSLRQAARNGIISKNPMKNTTPPKFKDSKKGKALSADIEKQFLEAAKESYYYPLYRMASLTGMRIGDDDDKIRLNQRKPSKYKGLSRFGPEKNLQRINKFMKERPTFYKKLIQMKENFRFYLRCFYCITKVVILQFNSEKQDRISS